MDGRSKGLGRSKPNQIDVLSDDVLLEIFDLYVDSGRRIRTTRKDIGAWQTLVHVCQCLTFRSLRRLNLRLFCTPETLAEDTLDAWPALPLIVRGYMTSSSGTDNLITVLGQSNRVCQASLTLVDRLLENVLAAMQVPFPELTDLRLTSHKILSTIPIPDSFLGGSAPLL